MNGLVSVLIPSRNETYLQKTIQDLLTKATGPIEVIAVLDGYWPPPNEIVEDPRVHYLHYSNARGMRNAINSAVSLAKGEFLLKTDAHCMFAQGFDEALKNCEDNWVVVPRRYRLDVERWAIREDKPWPVDYMYLSSDLHGREWDERNNDPTFKDKPIDDLMSAQGSCWFMKKSYYQELELLDEAAYGTFYLEFQEIGLKCWLSGGRVVVNKNTWYAHWHKPKDVGRGYRLDRGEEEKAQEFVKKWSEGKGWHKQDRDLKWLVRKFWPVPTWEQNYGQPD